MLHYVNILFNITAPEWGQFFSLLAIYSILSSPHKATTSSQSEKYTVVFQEYL